MHWKWECENDQTLKSHTSYLILITCSLHSKAYGFSHTQKIFLALFSVDPCNEGSSRKRKQLSEFHPVKLIKICKVIYHLFIFSFGNRLRVFSRKRSQKRKKKTNLMCNLCNFVVNPSWYCNEWRPSNLLSSSTPLLPHSMSIPSKFILPMYHTFCSKTYVALDVFRISKIKLLASCLEKFCRVSNKAHQTNFFWRVSSDSNQESEKEKEKAEEIKIKGSLSCADC